MLSVAEHPSGNVRILLGGQNKNTSVKLINALGQVICYKTYMSTNEITFEIEGATGVYFLEIETAEGISTQKVIKN